MSLPSSATGKPTSKPTGVAQGLRSTPAGCLALILATWSVHGCPCLVCASPARRGVSCLAGVVPEPGRTSAAADCCVALGADGKCKVVAWRLCSLQTMQGGRVQGRRYLHACRRWRYHPGSQAQTWHLLSMLVPAICRLMLVR